MKIIHLFNNFSPKKYCGAELGAATLGLMGSLWSADSQSTNVNTQTQAQKEENQLNRDWQTQEAEKARQFSAQQSSQQNQFQTGLQAQQQQYNLQSMKQQAYYNSPVYQRQQLEAANINPQVYFGQQSSFSGSSAQAGGSPSANSSPSGAMVGSVGGLSPISYQPIGTSIASILGAVGSSLRDVAQARKLGVEADWLPQTLRAQVRNLNKDSDLKTLLGVGQTIHNAIDKAKFPYAVQMAESELYKNLAAIDLTSQQTLTEKTKQAVNVSLDKLQNALSELHGKEAEKIGLEMPYYINLIKSKINESSASAELHSASAKSENEFRATRGAILGLEYAIKNNEVDISNSTVKAAILSALNKAVQEKWRTKEAYVDYLSKKYKLDTKGIKDAINIITGWIPFAPGISD